MKTYRPAGQEFQFPYPVLELAPFGTSENPEDDPVSARASFAIQADSPSPTLLAQTDGLVGGAARHVETWSAPLGYLLKVTGGSDFFISANGQAIQHTTDQLPWPKLDREILIGPALVLALALRGVWSLHTSAVTCNGRVFAFLGDSGQGKSTLASSLVPAMQLVADDILPVSLTDSGLTCWPHFPQLKLPLDAQPGPVLPESLPIGHICLLDTGNDVSLSPVSAPETIQILLHHTAGTRIFPPDLLAKHLAFCAQAASKIGMSRLTYPRRMDALPNVKNLLETLC